MNKTILFIVLIALCMAVSGVAFAEPDLLQASIDGEHRAAESKARDVYRHPAETLTFFEVAPDMKVLEIWPGNKGWYTEILAPYLAPNGRLTVALFGEGEHKYADYFATANKDFTAKFLSGSDRYGKIKTVHLLGPAVFELGEADSYDRVLTFRNLHNWIGNGQAEATLAAFFRVLKSGGILGVTDHRANPELAVDSKAESGYVNEDEAIRLITAAGFQLLGRSDINNNPKDTKDHKYGVWTLPPTMALKEVDAEKYRAIGESDRFTLRFVKP